MASPNEERWRHDRKAWDAAVERILGQVPDQAAGDDAHRMASALRVVSSLLERLSLESPAQPRKAA